MSSLLEKDPYRDTRMEERWWRRGEDVECVLCGQKHWQVALRVGAEVSSGLCLKVRVGEREREWEYIRREGETEMVASMRGSTRWWVRMVRGTYRQCACQGICCIDLCVCMCVSLSCEEGSEGILCCFPRMFTGGV